MGGKPLRVSRVVPIKLFELFKCALAATKGGASGYLTKDSAPELLVESLVEAGDKVLYADSTYRSEKISSLLETQGIANRIHEKGHRNHPLTEEQKASNKEKSRVRARVEPVFGQMTNTMKEGLYLRYIGIKRIIAGVGLLNLAYNILRYEQIRRLGLV